MYLLITFPIIAYKNFYSCVLMAPALIYRSKSQRQKHYEERYPYLIKLFRAEQHRDDAQ